MSFLAQYGKTYATKSDLNTRFDIFSQNYDHIEEHNSNNEHFKKAINKFSDLTEEEFTNRYLRGLKPEAKKVRGGHKKVSSTKLEEEALPEMVDWN